MKAPLSWLRDFAPIEGMPARAGRPAQRDRPHRRRHPRPRAETSPGSRTVKVLAVETHPDADRLALVDVDPGDGNAVRVVCGAHNYVVRRHRPLGPARGRRCPAASSSRRRKIRGQVSDGMLCAPDELGLSDDHSGIMILAARHAARARTSATVLGLDDVVFDLEITPNRPDAMSIAGVARDLAAALGVPFTLPQPAAARRQSTRSPPATLVVEAPDRCPRYVARTAAPSPSVPSPGWMAQRLTKAGMRPDLQRRRRHQLRDAGAGPAPARLRPRPARRPGHRRPHWPTRARRSPPSTASSGPCRAADLLICDANRRAPGHRRRDGRPATPRSPTPPPRCCWSRPTSRRRHPAAPPSASACGRSRRARFERGVDPNGTARRRRPGLGAVRRDRLRPGRRRRPRRLPGPDRADPGARCGRPGSTPSSAPTSTPTRIQRPPRSPSASTRRAGYRQRRAFEYTVPTYRPDCDAGDRPHRGGRPPPRLQQHRPHAAPHEASRPAGSPPLQLGRRAVRDALPRHRSRPRPTPSPWSRPPTWPPPACPPRASSWRTRCGPRSRCSARPCCPACSRRWPSTPATASPTSACSRSATSSCPRPPGRRCPTNGSTSPSCWPARSSACPTSPTGPSTATTSSAGSKSSPTPSASPTGRSSPATPPGFTRGRAAAVLVDGDGGRRGRRDRPGRPSVRPRPARHRWPPSRSTCPRLLAATRKERRSVTPSRYPASAIDLAFVLDEAGAGRRRPAHAAHDRRRPPRRRPPVRRLPLRRPRPQQEEPRLRPALPGSGPHPHRRGGRRPAPAPASTPWPRNTAPASGDDPVGSSIGAARPTPRSTSRASSSTAIGWPTSTTP